jgi:acetyl-CoA C-acetyltransferase
MTNHAYIFDAIRTPRSKGKKDGALHEVKPVDLAAGVLRALQSRLQLDTSYVDDVVMGCVAPVGEQGSDITKMAVMNADWDESVPGVQLDRFCASGLEAVNIAAQKWPRAGKTWWSPVVSSLCRGYRWDQTVVLWVEIPALR